MSLQRDAEEPGVYGSSRTLAGLAKLGAKVEAELADTVGKTRVVERDGNRVILEDGPRPTKRYIGVPRQARYVGGQEPPKARESVDKVIAEIRAEDEARMADRRAESAKRYAQRNGKPYDVPSGYRKRRCPTEQELTEAGKANPRIKPSVLDRAVADLDRRVAERKAQGR